MAIPGGGNPNIQYNNGCFVTTDNLRKENRYLE